MYAEGVWKPFYLPHLDVDFVVWVGGRTYQWRSDPAWTLG